ncbi:MAG: hypothetical protein GEU89_14720 [Kiloniellaceae bacterium]|nr:hypothetical protein [Kiloniellaceae bacterium]
MTSRRLALVTCLFLAPALGAGDAVRAQSGEVDDTTKLADEIIGCSSLENKDARLECYDALAQPLLGIEEPTAEDEGSALQSFTGTDDWDSEVLEIDAPWRLVWQNQGSMLTVELWTSQNEMLDVIGNQIGRGGGRSEVLDPGSYRLAVRGLGGWRIQVVSEERG